MRRARLSNRCRGPPRRRRSNKPDLISPQVDRRHAMANSSRAVAMNVRRLLLALALVLIVSAAAAAQGTRLLRQPTVSQDLVAFEYGGDLWVVSRNGGQARRLTSTPGVEADPRFSPDGSLIAFTATIAGNTDVYVVPTSGGDPKRLTYHPGIDRVRGWTPD